MLHAVPGSELIVTNAGRDADQSLSAAELFRRWTNYVEEARAELGADAPFERIVDHVATEWARREPPELAFVPDEVVAEARERRHESAESNLLARVERGELVALRRTSDGEVVYLTPARVESMTAAERAHYEPYDPVLARALRRHAMDAGYLPSEEGLP